MKRFLTWKFLLLLLPVFIMASAMYVPMAGNFMRIHAAASGVHRIWLSQRKYSVLLCSARKKPSRGEDRRDLLYREDRPCYCIL